MGIFDIFSGGGDQTVESEPWDPQKPYLKDLFRAGRRGILDRPLEYYPGQTVAPFSRPTRYGLNAMMGRALMGNPLNPAAQQSVMDTLGGQYLTGGDYYDDILDSVISGVQPGIESGFATAGRTGSALANEAVGRGVSRGMSPFLNAERGRMMQAAQMAPMLAREDYYDMDRLLGVGQTYENKYRERIQDAMNRWNFAQDEPYQRISRYGQTIGAPISGTQTTAGAGGNPLMQLLGMGIMGAGVAGGLGWQPFGAPAMDQIP